MNDLLVPGKTVTFTVAKLPARPAARKTIQRLMRMQPDIRRGLKRLQKTRPLRNRIYQRAGGMWNARVKATRLTRVEAGESFTLQITPQIVPDLRSVAPYLSAK